MEKKEEGGVDMEKEKETKDFLFELHKYLVEGGYTVERIKLIEGPSVKYGMPVHEIERYWEFRCRAKD